MKANEIRIGNIVTVDNPLFHPNLKDVPMLIKGIYETERGYAVKLEHIVPSDDIFTEYSQLTQFIRPIPLTEEILIKAGFEKKEFTRFTTFKLNRVEITNVEFFDEDKDGKEFSFKQWRISGLYSSDLFYFKSYSPNIKSVHQLQNLIFALMGEEIKIEL